VYGERDDSTINPELARLRVLLTMQHGLLSLLYTMRKCTECAIYSL